jgi:hypothetical protein
MRRFNLGLAAAALVALAVIFAARHRSGPVASGAAHAGPPTFRSYGARLVDAGTMIPPTPQYAVLVPFESELVAGVPPS